MQASRRAPGSNITVVIPALNEESTISGVIDEIHRYLPKAPVVVVDGGSTDRTVLCAADVGALVVKCPEKGYGRAIKEGIKHVTTELVLMVDADGTYDLSNIEELAALADSNSVVVGCRFHSKPRGMSLVNYVGNWLLTRLIGVVWWLRIRDSQSGLKIFPASLSSSLREDGMAFSSEVLIRAKEAGMRVLELTIHDYRKRKLGSASKLRVLDDGIGILLFVLRSRLQRA